MFLDSKDSLDKLVGVIKEDEAEEAKKQAVTKFKPDPKDKSLIIDQ